MVMLMLLGVLLPLFAVAYRNTFDMQTIRVPITLNRSERLQDKAFTPLRVLHLSDLHMENLSVKPERIMAEVEEQAIDLIAITGDLLDRARNIPKAIEYVSSLKQLNAPLGIFVVFGNHDYLLPAAKLAELKRALQDIGCHVLQNETITLNYHGEKLHIIGIDDFATRRSDLARSYQGVGEEGIRLVLTHDPNVVLHMADYDYDYLLSGHFHGGQIHWPKPYHLWKMGKLPRMNVVKGLHYYDGRPFYISEGLGQTGVNIRLRSRPEITLHTLQAADQTSEAVHEQSPRMEEVAPALAID